MITIVSMDLMFCRTRVINVTTVQTRGTTWLIFLKNALNLGKNNMVL